MQILGSIISVVGVVLLIVGRNVGKYLPPDYQKEEDDGFLQLLQSMGRLISGAGAVFLVIGIIIILSGIWIK
ncbi:MAG: hypothetical protein K2J90_06675 [Lachnospiraceae bacterium]|nr:hypothetical protein [Lachnospiraceae bacterium]